MSHISRFTMAVGMGAVAMYLLDPVRGRRRRALLRDRILSTANAAADAAGGKAQDLANRARGRVARIVSLVRAPLVAEATVTIGAPLERVFDFASRHENFPRFMGHVRDVRPAGERSHWVIAGPAGPPMEWETETTAFVPNQVIAWRTVPGAPVEHAGVVRFDRVPGAGTEVRMRMAYHTGGGPIGRAVAALVRGPAGRGVDEDLGRLKALCEVPGVASTPGVVQRQGLAS